MKLRLLFSSLMAFLAIGLFGQTVGIVGSSTPNGWDGPDIEMTQVPDSANLFTVTTTLVQGAAKFRLNNDWATNWGSSDFPTGIGTQDGSDIPVFTGEYVITFDTLSGAYSFEVISDVGIIGDATPKGWDEDTNMYEDTTGLFFITLDLSVGSAKFRANDDWARNWGGNTFPSGMGVQDGDNIPVDKAGTYFITIDTATGIYEFAESITYESIGIIGSATPGGWDVDSNLVQDANDPNVWNGVITLTEGEIKFRANDDWIISWGGGEFPMDTAVLDGANIVAIPGEYQFSFNTETGIYNFLEIINYESIGIIGDAVDGWDAAEDRDMVRSETDSSQWSLRTDLLDGELKFRANNDWPVNWGAGEFPTGQAVQDGPNVPITAGEYIIHFNTTTGAYEFVELVIYDTVGIVGTATGIDDGWNNDVYMNKDAVDEQLWTLGSVDMVDGEAKFRAESDWAVNWGADTWPSGAGTQDGPNIPVVAGTYMVSLRTDDGMFAFQEPSSVHTQSILKEIKIYPNPTDNFIMVEMNSENISGKVNIEIIDVTGKRVSIMNADANTNVRVDVSSLVPGNYFVKMYNSKFMVAKPITVK